MDAVLAGGTVMVDMAARFKPRGTTVGSAIW